MNFKHLFAAVLVTAGAGAHAATITWNQWSSSTAGTMGTVTVGYNAGGNYSALVANYPSWNPAATWADGAVVANAPPQANGTATNNSRSSRIARPRRRTARRN